ncbi:MAG TPA: N-acetylmuramoyl-L-alanine amidase [Ruminococcaceae bacterium]|nr:N-acetylmuramoyl-L-alanine amidase [Oscillospiraceae bacterium]
MKRIKRRALVIVLAFFVLSSFGCRNASHTEKPAVSESVSRTLEATQPNTVETVPMLLPHNLSETRTEKITHVVLHFSSSVVRKPEQPFLVEDIIDIFKDYQVSAHYLIARDGQIYQLVSEDRVAYHAGKGSLDGYPEYADRLNQYSIGIEMLAIGTKDEMSTLIHGDVYDSLPDGYIGYTQAQYIALNKLLDSLLTRHLDIKKDKNHIIGHDEYAKNRKTDPGCLFDWSKIGLQR